MTFDHSGARSKDRRNNTPTIATPTKETPRVCSLQAAKNVWGKNSTKNNAQEEILDTFL